MKEDELKEVFILKKLEFNLEFPQSAPCSLITKQYLDDPTAADAVYKSTQKLFLKYVCSSRAILEV